VYSTQSGNATDDDNICLKPLSSDHSHLVRRKKRPARQKRGQPINQTACGAASAWSLTETLPHSVTREVFRRTFGSADVPTRAAGCGEALAQLAQLGGATSCRNAASLSHSQRGVPTRAAGCGEALAQLGGATSCRNAASLSHSQRGVPTRAAGCGEALAQLAQLGGATSCRNAASLSHSHADGGGRACRFGCRAGGVRCVHVLPHHPHTGPWASTGRPYHGWLRPPRGRRCSPVDLTVASACT
jgi:hypothetical protein